MKRLICLCIAILISIPIFAQEKHLKLYQLPKKTKVRKIKLNSNINFRINTVKTDTSRNWNTIHGKLVSVDKDHIMLRVSKEEKIISSKTDIVDYYTWKTITYKDSVEDLMLTTYAKENIEYLEIRRENEKLQTAGITMMLISLGTVLVVAPLVSIDYSDWTFNANTYRNWALAGTAGVVVSIPLILFSSNWRRYSLDEKWGGECKCNWTFDE